MIGDNIKKIRTSQKLGLNALAAKAKVSTGYLSELENNISTNPTMDKLNKIAEALGVTVEEFFKEDGTEQPIENLDIEQKIKQIEVMQDFAEPEQALKFILSQPSLAAYGGYDLKNMSEEEILEIANDMLFAMRLSLEKMKKKDK